MISLDRFRELQRIAEKNQKEADKAAGVLEQKYKDLKSEFGCNGVPAAEKLLARKEAELKKLEEKFEEELQAFREKYHEHFE